MVQCNNIKPLQFDIDIYDVQITIQSIGEYYDEEQEPPIDDMDITELIDMNWQYPLKFKGLNYKERVLADWKKAMDYKYLDTKSYFTSLFDIKKVLKNLRIHINNFSLTFVNEEILK